MLTYCLKCKKKHKKPRDSKVLKTKNGKPFVLSKLLSKCAVCGSRK